MSRALALEGERGVGERTKNRLLKIAFLPQPHATSPREKWLAVKVCEATAKGGSTLTDRQLFTTIHNWWGCNDKGTTVRISARACRLQGGTRRPAANCARFAAPAATTNRRNSGCTAAPWVHKNRPAIRVRNDSLIKLGLFEPDGACSTAMMIS